LLIGKEMGNGSYPTRGEPQLKNIFSTLILFLSDLLICT
jgi:hypothetical protein